MTQNLIYKLEYLDELIRRKATGSPEELAQKLRMCERGVYNYIRLMKDLGATIKYCRKRNSYYYQSDGKFNFKFQVNDQF